MTGKNNLFDSKNPEIINEYLLYLELGPVIMFGLVIKMY